QSVGYTGTVTWYAGPARCVCILFGELPGQPARANSKAAPPARKGAPKWACRRSRQHKRRRRRKESSASAARRFGSLLQSLQAGHHGAHGPVVGVAHELDMTVHVQYIRPAGDVVELLAHVAADPVVHHEEGALG